MTTAAEDLLRRALALDDDERAQIASALLDSLAPNVPSEARCEAQWLDELERRVVAAKAGAAGISWKELRIRLLEQLERSDGH